MHRQTQSTQIFTVFGSYVLERDTDYFPLNGSRSTSQDVCGTEKMELVIALQDDARRCQQYQYSMAC